MTEFVFIYNNALLVLYSLTMAITMYVGLKEEKESLTRKNIFLMLSLYLLFFIFDNLVLAMTEVIADFGRQYNHYFLGAPLVKTVVYLVNNFCQLWIVTALRKEKMSITHYALVLSIFVWMLIPFMGTSALRAYLYYLPNQLLLIYTGYLAYKGLKDLTISDIRKRYLLYIAGICALFGLLILVEDSFVIFNLDSYQILNLKIQNRNFSEDLFSILICGLVFHYLTHRKSASTVETPEQVMSTNPTDVSLEDHFYNDYHLTEREKEICTLLLQYKHNQEIADALYLSLGTVKTHIHNIFLKLDITKRAQLFERYEIFKQEQK